MREIALVGGGLIGASWSIVFARAGRDVALYDPSAAALQAALDFVRDAAEGLARNGLLGGEDPAAVLRRIRPVGTLAEAVAAADYIQESAPERLDVKQALYAEMTPLARPEAVIASSTSGLPASSFSETATGRERCLVAHPINPPHLVPAVELVPAPWTSAQAMAAAEDLMTAVGQKPVRLKREIPGFVVNRLQGALLAEAFRLVEDGIVDTDGVDAAIAEGLGLRWFFIGPFATIDLNAPGGIADYCDRFGAMYHDLARDQARPRRWTPDLVRELERQVRRHTPADSLEARRRWRDRTLAAVADAKRRILGRDAG
jgi:3-hydroxyacyl-CoA dehydrogenase